MRKTTNRTSARAIAAATAIFVASTSAASAQAQAGAQTAPIRGTVGVCVRWGSDPTHVEEAVIVAPSRNDALNSFVTGQMKAVEWQKPDSTYHGQWEGVNLVFGQIDPDTKLPDCKSLRAPSTP